VFFYAWGGAAGRLHLAEADDVGVAAVPGCGRVRTGAGGQCADHARAPGVTLRNGDWVLAGVDLSMIAFGAMLALCGWRMQRWTPPLSAAEKKKRAAAAAAPKASVDAAETAEAEASA
jgi:hypothetical protein